MQQCSCASDLPQALWRVCGPSEVNKNNQTQLPCFPHSDQKAIHALVYIATSPGLITAAILLRIPSFEGSNVN